MWSQHKAPSSSAFPHKTLNCISVEHHQVHRSSGTSKATAGLLNLSPGFLQLFYLLFALLRLRSCDRKSLLKVRNDVANVLCPDRDANEIFSDSSTRTLLITELFVCRGPWMDCEGFRVADTAEDD